MNARLLLLVMMGGLLPSILALPVVTQKPTVPEEKKDNPEENTVERMESIIEYNKYLQEVVNVLESDPAFAEKLQKAAETDIRSGKIAQELEFVSHHVRSRLDELKRMELQRLKEAATRQFELTNEIDRDHLKISGHLDHSNPHTFEIDDLKKLILKTSQDLMENDRRRREDFKQYELQKEFEKQEKLRALDEEHKKAYEEELKKQQVKHDNHEKIHHPGNKAQLEEVWEKQDHMDAQDFDPKTFFMLHDLDGNNMWDENEVKVLFINELNKMYQAGAPEDDMKERAEEMERMREHVFQEADTNKDGLISFEEFVEQTKRDEFQKDPEWETVDHQPQFTHDEYLEFERRRQEEVQRLIAQGKLPPHANMPQGYHPEPNGQYQVHPNAIPQQHYPPQQPPHYQQQQYHQQQQQQHYQQQQQQYQQQQHHQQYQQGPPPVPQPNHHPAQQQINPQGAAFTGQQSTVYSGHQQPVQNQVHPAPPQQHDTQQQHYQQQPPPQQQFQSNHIPQNAPQQHPQQVNIQPNQQPPQQAAAQPVPAPVPQPSGQQQAPQQQPPVSAQPSVVQMKH
ncbi:nucleobindin-2 [Anopheles bellator]|uniref:nucleobindin-2 n=1 Tax=Anopheles bellator TaxID=139047 RepID=UPI0026483257|nr:nucleobindin-2 [Anopheles bellator]XP_058055998.1 nucleobindin-2 [Anopheles bellator]